MPTVTRSDRPRLVRHEPSQRILTGREAGLLVVARQEALARPVRRERVQDAGLAHRPATLLGEMVRGHRLVQGIADARARDGVAWAPARGAAVDT